MWGNDGFDMFSYGSARGSCGFARCSYEFVMFSYVFIMCSSDFALFPHCFVMFLLALVRMPSAQARWDAALVQNRHANLRAAQSSPSVRAPSQRSPGCPDTQCCRDTPHCDDQMTKWHSAVSKHQISLKPSLKQPASSFKLALKPFMKQLAGSFK